MVNEETLFKFIRLLNTTSCRRTYHVRVMTLFISNGQVKINGLTTLM